MIAPGSTGYHIQVCIFWENHNNSAETEVSSLVPTPLSLESIRHHKVQFLRPQSKISDYFFYCRSQHFDDQIYSEANG